MRTNDRFAPRPWRCIAAAALALLVTLIAAAGAQDAPAEAAVAQPETYPVNVYYFWGDGCPICSQQRIYLDWLEEHYPEVEVHAFEVYRSMENRRLLEAMSAAFGRPVTGVPVTFIGEDAWIGFSQVASRQMTESVETYRTYDAPDAADRLPPEVREAMLPESTPEP